MRSSTSTPADAAPAPLHEGAGHAVEEDAHADDDADVRPARRLDVLAALVDQPDAGLIAGTDLDDQEDSHHDQDGRREYPEVDVGQLGADEFDARFVLHQPVDRPHEAVQHPHDHRVDVHHPVDVEVEDAVEELRVEKLQSGEEAEEHLRDEQHHRHEEVLERQALPGGQRRRVAGPDGVQSGA